MGFDVLPNSLKQNEVATEIWVPQETDCEVKIFMQRDDKEVLLT